MFSGYGFCESSSCGSGTDGGVTGIFLGRWASTSALTNKVTTTSTDIDDNSKQSAVAHRKDVPVSAPSRRLDKPIAFKATENDEVNKRALEYLGCEVSSSSTKQR